MLYIQGILQHGLFVTDLLPQSWSCVEDTSFAYSAYPILERAFHMDRSNQKCCPALPLWTNRGLIFQELCKRHHGHLSVPLRRGIRCLWWCSLLLTGPSGLSLVPIHVETWGISKILFMHWQTMHQSVSRVLILGKWTLSSCIAITNCT